MIKLIDYSQIYQEDFKRLSLEWLEKYLYLEPEDRKILDDPEASILKPGGHIYLLQYRQAIVGCMALIRQEKSFELAKLAISQDYKGLGLGNILMTQALDQAEKEGMEKIILYTNHKLVPALRLYEKFGFQRVDLGDNKYLESDIKMELIL